MLADSAKALFYRRLTMRKVLSWFAALTLLTVGIASAQSTPTIVTPDKITWVAGTGPIAGSQIAVLSGELQKSGPYTFRLKIPANTTLAPHFHGDAENVTVLSGSLWVGLGDAVDESKLVELPAGSFVSIPRGVHHYAVTKEETVIELHGYGPFTMTAVTP
jgi:quercetin dioxygenase-like cupin family protein